MFSRGCNVQLQILCGESQKQRYFGHAPVHLLQDYHLRTTQQTLPTSLNGFGFSRMRWKKNNHSVAFLRFEQGEKLIFFSPEKSTFYRATSLVGFRERKQQVHSITLLCVYWMKTSTTITTKRNTANVLVLRSHKIFMTKCHQTFETILWCEFLK